MILLLAEADNAPPMVVLKEIVTEILACSGNRNALVHTTRKLVI